MIRYRPFRNSDPPALAEIWRRHPPLRGLMQPMSVSVLERCVLSKPYFDRHGLIVAADEDNQPVGFAHAGFGADESRATLSTELGVTCMLMVAPHAQHDEIAAELLAASERYLRQHGVRALFAGGISPLDPFYLGLYGGSEMPGVLAGDTELLQLFTSSGYVEVDRCLILQRELAGFRPPVDRNQMQIRRQYRLEALMDPLPDNWWEACTLGQSDRTRFELMPRTGSDVHASATFWDLQPLAASWGVHAAGVVQVEVAADQRRKGLATFLIGESLRQLQKQGTSLAEVQVMQSNTAAIQLYKKLGFHETEQGIVLRKEA